jgi:hypothetical protein
MKLAYVDCDRLDANANQKFTWNLVISKADGTPYDLTGCAATCQIRATAQPGTPLVTPTATFATPANGTITFAYNKTQSAALLAPGQTPSQSAKFHVEVDLAYADDPTSPSARFVWMLAVSPGGNS